MQTNHIFQTTLTNEIVFNYYLSTPDDFDKNTESLPLIVFLHGAGERGNDIDKIKVYAVPKLFDKASPVRAITLSPQCPEETIWNHHILGLKKLIDEIVSEYNIDANRISITGLSMGGFGTWEMGIVYPDYFSAMAPICGGGISWRAGVLKDMPIRAFHGTCDTVVPPNNSIEMVDAVNRAGGYAELTLYEGVEHNSWDLAYEESDLIQWLISQSRQ